MKRYLIPAASLAVVGAAAFAVFPESSSGAVPRFRYRMQSGVVPHNNDGLDVLKVFVTNTSDKPASAVVVVFKLGANGQLDASPLVQSVPLTPRQEGSVTKALDSGTFDYSDKHAVEVLSSSPFVVATTQILHDGAEVPGRNLTYADFLRTKGSFPDPTK
jgi:hypothetical protein